MRWIAALLLLGIAALWGWALLLPKPPKPLDPRWVGTYELVGYEPPQKGGTNPFPRGQVRTYTFREDGSYRISVRVMGDFEARRFEGFVEVDDKLILCLTQVSHNLEQDPLPRQCYRLRREMRKEGEHLVLTHTEQGYELHLKRLEG